MIPGLIVILGSPNNERGELSRMGIGRVRAGLNCFQTLQLAGWKFLLSGGFGQHFNTTNLPHAEYARRMLAAEGVVSDDIFEPALSCNTVDDALKVQPILERHNVKQLVIVSSDFHMPRVEFIFRQIFPDRMLEFLGAAYIDLCTAEEQNRLLAHEARQLLSLQQKGESILG